MPPQAIVEVGETEEGEEEDDTPLLGYRMNVGPVSEITQKVVREDVYYIFPRARRRFEAEGSGVHNVTGKWSSRDKTSIIITEESTDKPRTETTVSIVLRIRHPLVSNIPPPLELRSFRDLLFTVVTNESLTPPPQNNETLIIPRRLANLALPSPLQTLLERMFLLSRRPNTSPAPRTLDDLSLTLSLLKFINSSPRVSRLADGLDLLLGITSLSLIFANRDFFSHTVLELIATGVRAETLVERVNFIMHTHAPLGFKLNPRLDLLLGNVVLVVADAWRAVCDMVAPLAFPFVLLFFFLAATLLSPARPGPRLSFLIGFPVRLPHPHNAPPGGFASSLVAFFPRPTGFASLLRVADDGEEARRVARGAVGPPRSRDRKDGEGLRETGGRRASVIGDAVLRRAPLSRSKRYLPTTRSSWQRGAPWWGWAPRFGPLPVRWRPWRIPLA